MSKNMKINLSKSILNMLLIIAFSICICSTDVKWKEIVSITMIVLNSWDFVYNVHKLEKD